MRVISHSSLPYKIVQPANSVILRPIVSKPVPIDSASPDLVGKEYILPFPSYRRLKSDPQIRANREIPFPLSPSPFLPSSSSP